MTKKKSPVEKQEYIDTLTADLEARWLELRRLTGDTIPPLNIIESRINNFIDYLVRLEIITKDQYLDFEIEQVEKIEDAVVKIEKDLAAKMEERKKEQASRQIIKPPGAGDKKLIIPAHAQRKPGVNDDRPLPH